MTLLARREHSRREMQRKLSSRGFDESVIQQVLEALVRERALSDDRFTEIYVHSRREKGYGPLRISQELRERGVDDGLIGDYVDERDPDWLELLRRVQLKKFGAGPPSSLQDKAKQIRFLQYRGFTHAQISRLFKDDFD
jgi:regulatory protein